MEQEIIKPVDKELLKSELTPDKQLRMTNKSHNEIYVITAHTYILKSSELTVET